MANSGKNKTQVTSKKTASNRKKTQKRKTEEGISIYLEIAMIVILLISALTFISFFGIGGKIGTAVAGGMFGIFGIVAVLVPIYVIVAVFLGVANRKNKIIIAKLVVAFLLICLLSGFVSLVYHGGNTISMISAYKIGFLTKKGGGWIGAMLCHLLVPNIGLIGAYLVIIAVILIGAIFITEHSIYSSIRNSQRNVKERRAAKKSVNEYETEINHRRRNKAVGVAFDTKIVEQNTKTDEMSELHSKEVYSPSAKEEIPFETPKDELVFTSPKEEVPFETSAEQIEIKKPIKRKKEELKIEAATEPVEVFSEVVGDYQFPPMELLKKGSSKNGGDSSTVLKQTAMKLEQTLRNFGVKVTVTDVSCGPSVTRFELQPEQGVKVSKIVGLADDIKLNLAAADIRIEAPIPGKAAVGIEVPNKENVTVMLRELLESEEFRGIKTKIPFSAGKDIGGKVIVSDIGKMPHVLIAGATGSGKSVCINTIVMSILYKARPDEVKLIMIDPKVVELSVYNGIPHLMIPVVTEPKKAAGALNWAVAEMTDRYEKFAKSNVRDLKGYNEHVARYNKEHPDTKLTTMPQIVIIVDELADLMMVAPGDVEDAICRLAQLARAAGIHLILATQRPSVNVITGLIKANMPSRVAFAVSSGVDSRTILDMNGAEKLLGKGDMLFYPQGYQKPLRVQGAYVSDEEVSAVVDFLKANNINNDEQSYHVKEMEEKVSAMSINGQTMAPSNAAATDDGRDVYFVDAAKLLIEKERGSIGMLQRMFKIGFNRAARIMDQLEEAGIVGPEEGTKPRKILVTMEEFNELMKENEDEV